MEKVKISFFLLLLSLSVFFIGINKIPVIDRDEAHFAQASKQMIQTGNYFQIRFQDKTRFQKPPGINWLQAASVKVLKQATTSQIWPYRIPSALGAFLSVLLTYLFASRFLKSTTAALAAGLLASSLLLVVEAHMAVIDAVLLFSVVLMQGALWITYQSAKESKKVMWYWPLCFWIALAFGVVLKGVTPLIGLLTILTLCLIDRRIDWLKQLKMYQGLALFIGLTLAWVIMVNKAENCNYLLQMITKDLLPKLQGGHESHGKPPFFHLASLPITFWPASLFLGFGSVYAWKNRQDSHVKFLLAWLLPSWIFFECMPTKLPQYVLPLFPALAILCALAIKQQLPLFSSKFFRFLQYFWAVLSVIISFSLILIVYWVNQTITLNSLIVSVLMILFSGGAVYFNRQGQFKHSAVLTIALAGITYPIIFSSILPSLKPIWFTNNIIQYIDKTKISSTQPLFVVGFSEPSLVFNLETQLVRFVDSNTAIQQLLINPNQLVLFEANALEAWSSYPNTIKILAQVRGFNYSKGHWIKLFLVQNSHVYTHRT